MNSQAWLDSIADKEGHEDPAAPGTAEALAAFKREDSRRLHVFLAARARGERGETEAGNLADLAAAHVAAIRTWAAPAPAPALLIDQACDSAELAGAQVWD